MKKGNLKFIVFYVLMVFTLTACGGGGSSSSEPTAKEKIEAYATSNTNPLPTLEDYKEVGVQGVTAENLDELNALVDSLEAEDVDTVEELNVLTSNMGINILPTVNAGADKTVQVNKTVRLTGTATDADGTVKSYAWKRGNKVLATTASFDYTPTVVGRVTLTFTGTDDDGGTSSDTVDILVTEEPNQAPVANGQTVTLDEDSTKAITLTGTDADSDALTYHIVTEPTYGTLSGTVPNLTYTPTANYHGTDSFTYKVNDGKADSATVTISINVISVKDAPIVNAGTDNTVQINNSITLVGTINDVEGNIVSSEWKRGNTVLATTLSFSYRPTSVRTETLTFTAIDIDGVRTSDSMNLVVTAKPNTAPIANTQTVTLDEDSTKIITLTGIDADSDALIYTVVIQPTHGTLTGTAPNLSYAPNENYFGSDEFSFKVNDGKVDSATVKVSISITSVNDAPTANAGADKTVQENETVRIIGIGTDIEGTVSYEWKRGNTVLSNTASFDYTPSEVGTDVLILTITDDKGLSATDTINVVVTQAPDTTAPNTPTLTTPAPTETTESQITLEVNGEVGAKVYVNGVDVATIGADGKVSVTLPLNSGDNSFSITLRDDADNESEALSFSVTRNEAQRPFIITVKTDNEGVTEDNQFKIGTNAESGTYNYTVDCNGDGVNEATGVTGDYVCTYDTAGTYTIKIGGEFPHFWMGYYICCNNETNYDRKKLLTIDQWGDIKWKSMKYSFYKCENMTYNAVDKPILTDVTYMEGMFAYAKLFNGYISDWNVSTITTMGRRYGLGYNSLGMFEYAESFNQPLDNWDVSNAINMRGMFRHAEKFNQPLDNWDVSNVKYFEGMFYSAKEFNQDLNNWNVSSARDMQSMFRYAEKFNQPLNSWDVSNVTDMRGMFNHAESFNQPLNNWDVSNVNSMGDYNSWSYGMFGGAISFNHSLNNWNVSNVTSMALMFSGATNFNQPLNSWDVSKVTDLAAIFNGATSFNQPLNSWDVSKVTNMREVFAGATSFNQPIDNWNVSSSTSMMGMFNGATSFNQPLNSWDVSNVTRMGYDSWIGGMFENATSFNQPISNWNVGNVTDMKRMFYRASAFNQNITTWDVTNVTNMDYMFYYSSSFTNYDLSMWNIINVTTHSNFMTGSGSGNLEPYWP